MNSLRLAILTISDACSRGERTDASGDHIAMWAKERGYTLAERALVPDETAESPVYRTSEPGRHPYWRMPASVESSSGGSPTAARY